MASALGCLASGVGEEGSYGFCLDDVRAERLEVKRDTRCIVARQHRDRGCLSEALRCVEEVVVAFEGSRIAAGVHSVEAGTRRYV